MPSISCLQTPHSAPVPGDLVRQDKPVSAWGAGISCLGSGIIPISLQNDASNPTRQVRRERVGAPRDCRRETAATLLSDTLLKSVYCLSNSPRSVSSKHESGQLKWNVKYKRLKLINCAIFFSWFPFIPAETAWQTRTDITGLFNDRLIAVGQQLAIIFTSNVVWSIKINILKKS